LKALGGEQGMGGVENLLAALRGGAVDEMILSKPQEENE